MTRANEVSSPWSGDFNSSFNFLFYIFNIVVMVEWNEETGKRYISKSLIFDVVDPKI